jgi:hypothetical protein
MYKPTGKTNPDDSVKEMLKKIRKSFFTPLGPFQTQHFPYNIAIKRDCDIKIF